MASLECLINETGADPVGTVIWLHGLGADATDFQPLVDMFEIHAPLRFVFPNAPQHPITINGGMEMRAWYDIREGSPIADQDDIDASRAQIEALIEDELEKGVAHEKITVAGFSQGGVIALESGLVAERKFAGIMALSTYVNNHEELTQRVALANLDTKIFMAHGLADPMIPITRAVTSREKLLELGYKVEWHEYSMGHQVCPQEIKDLETWLKSIYED